MRCNIPYINYGLQLINYLKVKFFDSREAVFRPDGGRCPASDTTPEGTFIAVASILIRLAARSGRSPAIKMNDPAASCGVSGYLLRSKLRGMYPERKSIEINNN